MKKQLAFSLFTCLFFLAISTTTSIQTKAQDAVIQLASTTVQVTEIAEGLHVPWEILWGPDDWIWITQRNGTISRLNPETGQIVDLITVDEVYEHSESGMLGMVLHPNFSSNPYAYVVYNYYDGGNVEKLVRFTYDATNNTLGDPYTLMQDITCTNGGNHSGSRIIILPDETLLMSTGDYYSSQVAQDMSSINGKMLRMTLTGGIPTDNPYPGSYVYSYGHRNPQGLVLADNGIIYSSEHGGGSDDELNIIEPSLNYGWPEVEGFCDNTAENTFCTTHNVYEPMRAWTPTLAVCGLAYYNHPAIPEWQHSLLLTSLKQSDLRVLKLSADGLSFSEANDQIYLDDTHGRMRSVCVSPDGRIFVGTSEQDGRGEAGAGSDFILELKAAPSFISTNTNPCTGDAITFEDLISTYTPTAWQWTFPGGTPSSSTDAMPTVSYTSSGMYEVTLEVFNGANSEIITKANYINVLNLNTGLLIPYSQDFQNATSDFTIVNPDADALSWETVSTSCNGTSYSANNFNNNATGTEDILQAAFDLTGFQNCELTFDVAYGPYPNYVDRLQVRVTSCTTTSVVYAEGGLTLSTIAAGSTDSQFAPADCSEWRTETVDISAFDGEKIMLDFVNINGYGNLLYLDNINLIGDAANTPTSIVQAKLLLEGAYNTGGMMHTNLRDQNLLPLAQPYNRPPWNYQGTENVATANDIPSNTTDWVLLQILDDSNNLVEERAAFLLNNGSIVDIDGSTVGVNFYNLVNNESYYLLARHRNHLDVMSSTMVEMPNSVAYDFTDVNNIYGGTTQAVNTGNGYALFAGDLNGNGIVSVADFNFYLSQGNAINDYLDADCNLNDTVTTADYNLYKNNASIIGITQIRY